MDAPQILFVPATAAHAEELAVTMRPEDLAESIAAGFQDGRDALRVALEKSQYAFTATVDGKVAALFGVAHFPFIQGVDTVWFLTGTAFLQKARHFLPYAHVVVEQLLSQSEYLMNFIDARYEAAVRWAKWLGFHICPPVPYGPMGLPFHPAVLRRK